MSQAARKTARSLGRQMESTATCGATTGGIGNVLRNSAGQEVDT